MKIFRCDRLVEESESAGGTEEERQRSGGEGAGSTSALGDAGRASGGAGGTGARGSAGESGRGNGAVGAGSDGDSAGGGGQGAGDDARDGGRSSRAGGRGARGDDRGDRRGRGRRGGSRGRGRRAGSGGATGQTELAGVVGGLAILADLKSVVGTVGKVAGDGPGESTSGSSGCRSNQYLVSIEDSERKRTGEGANSVKVGGKTLAEEEGGGGVIGRGVGDSVGLTSLNTTSWVLVDLKGESSYDESSAGSDHLEETHVDVVWGGVVD